MTTQDYRTRRPLRIFLSYFKPHWKLFSLDIGCAVLIAMVDLAFPLISRKALYQWLPDKDYRVFFTVMAVVALAFVLRAGLYYIVTYWGHTFGIRVEADIRRDLFHHMQTLGFDFYDRNRTGQLMSRLTTDLFELTELAHHGPEDLVISIITIVGALAVMFAIEWRMALIVMAIIPLFLVLLMLLRGGMSRASTAAKQKTGAINAEIESGLSGIRTVKAFGNERIQQQRFDCANEMFKTAKRGFHREMGRFNAVMELFVTLLNVAVIAGGGWLMMGGRMDYVDLITFSLYITTFITPVRKLANFAELFSNGFAGLHRFIELMRMEPTVADAPDAAAMEQVRGAIDVADVSFSYDGAEEVLHAVPADPPVLRRDGRRDPHRWHGCAARPAGRPAARYRCGAAGRVPVCRHRAGEYPLRPPGCQRRGGGAGSAEGGYLRGHHGHAPGVRHLCGRAGHAALRRTKAAYRHCADIPEGSGYSDPGRGHLGAGQCDGGADPAGFR